MQKGLILAAVFSLTFVGSLARAGSPVIPDPPGLITFQTTKLKSATAAEPAGVEGCDTNYRTIVETGFRDIWSQCTEFGKAEPSDCQRALFNQCVRAAQELRGLQTKTCAKMASEAAKVNPQTSSTLTQNTSESTNSTLNNQAAAASRNVAGEIDSDAKSLDRSWKEVSNAMKNPVCAMSTDIASYQALGNKVGAAMAQAQRSLEAMAQQKRKDAEGYTAASTKSQNNVDGLVSGSSSDISGTTTTSTTVGPTSTHTTLATNTATPIPEDFGSGKKKGPNLLPLLGVGIPAAVLLGVAASGLGDDKGGGSGGSKDFVPGSGTLRESGMLVDPSLSDEEKGKIAKAVQLMPDCHRPKLRGIKVARRTLNPEGKNRSTGCIAGLYKRTESNGTFVLFDTKCEGGLTVGTVVHEFYHVVGFANGEALHAAYKKPHSTYECAASPYGREGGLKEDFAECGRILAINDGPRNTGACVDKKLAEFKKLVHTCR